MPFFLEKDAFLDLVPFKYFRIGKTRTWDNLIRFDPNNFAAIDRFKFRKTSTFDNYNLINEEGTILRKF